MNWSKIMKAVTDDLNGFFAHGGWTFLETDGDDTQQEGAADESDLEEEDYNPEEDDSGEEGSESEYSGEDEDDEEFHDEESESGKKDLSPEKSYMPSQFIIILDVSENLGSDEESGKSWSELEEEARKGNLYYLVCIFSRLCFCFVTADAEKLDYDSDNGGRNKKKSASNSKQASVTSKKRPTHSPPPSNNKKKKR